MNQMQELLHMEEVEINAQKKRTKFKFYFKKKLQIHCALTFENFRSGKIGSNFHYKFCMHPMQELLHIEEVEINAKKKEEKIQKKFKSIVS